MIFGVPSAQKITETFHSMYGFYFKALKHFQGHLDTSFIQGHDMIQDKDLNC